MITSNIFIQELRDKLSLAEVVGKKVSWDNKKSNQSKGIFWACCPFHDEKTASFKVDDIKGLYYCFGCHEKGDCITFLRKTENLDFVSAIRRLASESGLQIPNNFETKQDPTHRKNREAMLSLHNLAVKFYINHLKENQSKSVLDFLKNRIGSRQLIDDFQLGFAPEGKKSLFNYLSNQGYAPDIIINSGLCARNDNGEIYDRFRNRIIFPIINQRDEIVGLGGRALSSSAQAKYLNSPETEIFQKGKLLFNQNNFVPSMQKENNVIVVEGYMDVIALSKVGLKNCVAPLGTAVTSDQLQKIWRLSSAPIFAFDGDTSGEKALARLAFLSLPLISAEKTIQACKLPTGMDPDDLVSKFGKETLITLLEKPQSLLEIIWEHETKGKTYKTPENRASLENRINAILKDISNTSLRNHFSSAFYELKKKLFSMSINSYSNFLRGSKAPKYNRTENIENKFRYLTNQPTKDAKTSLLGSDTKPDSMESRFQETAIVISLINHPKLITSFASQLNEITFLFKDLKTIYQNIISLNTQRKMTRKDLLDKLNDMSGRDVYQQLISTGHLQVNPFLNEFSSFNEAQMTLDDVLTRKIAKQNLIQELADAQEDIQENNDETLTWRLGQANKFLHHAQSGKSIPNTLEKKTLEEDIEEINNLIKDEIWIKTKSKKKTNH